MKEYIKIIIYILIFVILIFACTKLYENLSNDYNQDIILENSVSTENGNLEKNNIEEEKIVEKAKDFSVTNQDGQIVKLSDYFGSPIVVNFWATWCSPCKSELPAFEELSKEYDGKVKFMMVNLTDGYQETVEIVKECVNANNYPVFFDTEYSASSAYQINYIPETIFIDKDGNMVNKYIGAMNKETLKKYIDTLIGE